MTHKKMLNTGSYNCVSCDYVITNPICAQCLSERMATMVQELDEKLANQIRGFDIKGDTRCIQCSRQMALCAHCFSMDVYEFLLENNQEIAEQFLRNFDFELRRSLVNHRTLGGPQLC